MEKAEERRPGFLPPFKHFATQAIHVGQEPEQWKSMAVVPPISLSTTFKQQAPGEHCLVWIETPTNPVMKVIDIQGCADIVHKHKGILLAVDNTFMSAYFQRPLSLGADICMYSATKYMNGHSDVVMGLVSVNDNDLYERLKFLQYSLGAVPSPFDAYLCNRGLKTLSIRMKQHFRNAQLFALAVSLGDCESLAEHPAIMTHASIPKAEREALGISDTLIRMSIGLEDSEDLLEDLDQALKAAFPDNKVRN
ncbi:cystathionine gamma-lyase-like isoform X4 [Eublepharis macularius]|uniref:Cystathionine gamma-lyase n=1 Tax=Eublepharis macularius TaxID=481883 RepID=A0AA97JBG4_EUBMA|nr:cystathionine gamma-lyase-like isoform X4 [Eublepharis macularius]